MQGRLCFYSCVQFIFVYLIRKGWKLPLVLGNGISPAITHMASWPIEKPRPSPPIKFPRHGRAHMTGSPIDDEKFLLVSYLIGVRHLRAPLEARMRRSHLPVGQDHLGLPSPRVSMRSRRCRAICLNLLNLVLQLPKNGVGHLQNHRSHLLRRKYQVGLEPPMDHINATNHHHRKLHAVRQPRSSFKDVYL